jgi:hypothetical protein
MPVSVCGGLAGRVPLRDFAVAPTAAFETPFVFETHLSGVSTFAIKRPPFGSSLGGTLEPAAVVSGPWGRAPFR